MIQNERKSGNNVKFIVKASLIAAIYVVLVMVFAPISFSVFQVRIAEALTILPFFTPAAIPGLFVGCLLGNIIGGAIIWDIVFGSLATLCAAVISYKLRKKSWLVPVPPIIINTVVVGVILKYAYGLEGGLLFLMGTVFVGEIIAVYGIGMILLNALKPLRKYIEK